MWPMQTATPKAPRIEITRMSARGRLTADVLERAVERDDDALSLQSLRPLLDEVLAQDARFPFHLAAYVREKTGRKRLALALLVESANRARRLTFSLRPVVARLVREGADAAYVMAYQVRHFGWSMPSALRMALEEVVDAPHPPRAGRVSSTVPSIATRLSRSAVALAT